PGCRAGTTARSAHSSTSIRESTRPVAPPAPRRTRRRRARDRAERRARDRAELVRRQRTRRRSIGTTARSAHSSTLIRDSTRLCCAAGAHAALVGGRPELLRRQRTRATGERSCCAVGARVVVDVQAGSRAGVGALRGATWWAV